MIQGMVASYISGKKIKEVATEFGISAGKTYYILRDAGCAFRRCKLTHHSEATKQKISAAHKGKTLSAESRRKLSEAKRCHYDGMNGYGHTKKHTHGYELVYAPDHPNAHADGYVLKHTVVLERQIGRYLAPDEVAHHINHIRNDNRPENLMLMNRHEHMSMHMRERYAKGGMTY